MKLSFKKTILKTLRITGITLGILLLLLFLIPILFPGTTVRSVKSWTNERINGEMNFSKVRLSFFDHFPSLTVSLLDFSLKGSAPFKKDTLVAARKISFGINIRSLLFDKKVKIDKIFLADAYIHVLVNENGAANYNVYKSTQKQAAASTDTAAAELRLEKIRIKNSHIVYDDRSLPMLIDAKGFNYRGDGDLSASVFDLNSNINVDSLDFSFDHEPYLQNKKLNADLVTKINTNSFAFIFEKNLLRINKLPAEFTGKFNFLKNGYDLDFAASSLNSELDDFVTALPPQYVSWQKNTTIRGKTDIRLTLKGQYIASENRMPDLAYDMKIREGYVKYEDAPVAASALQLNLHTKLPSIDPELLQLDMDSLYFKLNQDYFAASIHTSGLSTPTVKARVNAALNLEQLNKAFGLPVGELKGRCDLHFTADGKYARGANPHSLRHEEVLLSIPAFNLKAAVKNGFFKYHGLPQAISNINFALAAQCNGNDYRKASFRIDQLSAVALGNFIKGRLSVQTLDHPLLDADLQTQVQLAEVKQFYPLENISLAGLLKLDVKSTGVYDAAAGKYPVTRANIDLDNGSIQTAWYPSPIKNISIRAEALNSGTGLSTQELTIGQAAFDFEDKPFSVKAVFKNFDDIVYDVTANGELDIEKMYKVFARKGWGVTGYVKANLHLQGTQSDALHNRYSRLHNEGTLELTNIATTTEYLPLPFVIKEGLFRFQQDKMWFNHFAAVYGQSDLQMNGYLQNVIGYATSTDGILRGKFNLQSANFNADEWMVFGAAAPAKDSASAIVDTGAVTGVVMIPANLDLDVNARAKKVVFNGVQLDELEANLALNRGTLKMTRSGFGIIGCKAVMDADYTATSIESANFSCHIEANEFDIKKAYDSIKLFRDMATAAGSSQGIVSLKYSLKGRLDKNMQPVYPSLAGGGVLSVKAVKVKGFRLFNSISKKTGKDSIANPDVTKVDIRSTVKNNLVTVERFKIKMAGFRLRMEGQTSFDGNIRFKMRLGLPPLGILGIPMNVTGTSDHPRIKLGKGDNEPLAETSDGQESPDQ